MRVLRRYGSRPLPRRGWGVSDHIRYECAAVSHNERDALLRERDAAICQRDRLREACEAAASQLRAWLAKGSAFELADDRPTLKKLEDALAACEKEAE